jgi:acetylornithine deacetylase/succinyl-diaminopimelate desuccinylase-like protein
LAHTLGWIGLLTLMATLFTQTATNPVEQLAQDVRVARALAWFDAHKDWITEEHIRISEVPAPPFQEKERAAHVRKLLEGAGLRLRYDDEGNVVGERAGTTRDVVLITAHLDTVFPPGTDVRVQREGPPGSERLVGPGISDNANGVAALVAVARAVQEGKLRTRATLVFAGNVGEEGEGNLRGMRKLVESYRSRLRYVVVIDGSSTEHVTSLALASRRVEVTVTGPGGHSWTDFGLPNPIQALARGMARFAKTRVPESPRSSFNVGLIEGGTSVNSIPNHAAIKVDLRSESDRELDRLENALREAIQAGLDEEMDASRARNGKLEAQFRTLGVRPGGELASHSPLLEAIRNVDRYLGNRSRLERSSTDANIPLSLGIPAVAVGGGGRSGAAHSPREWYEPAGREVGLKRVLLTVLSVAGVAE